MFTSKHFQKELESSLQTVQGQIGIYAQHIPSKNIYIHNHQQRFWMASTYKIPMAIYCLTLIQQGTLSLEQPLKIKSTYIRTGSDIIKNDPTLINTEMTLAKLIRLMMEYSDNTATDIILKLIGGPQAVTDFVRSIGIQEMDVNRTILRSFADYMGLPNIPDNEELTLKEYFAIEKSISIEQQEITKANCIKNRDNRDTATPEAMGHLLLKLVTGELLNESLRDYLLNCMQVCKTGKARMRALLPQEAKVAQKTGTIAGVVNDAGLIEFPNGIDKLILVIYVDDHLTSVDAKESVIANIASIFYKEIKNNC